MTKLCLNSYILLCWLDNKTRKKLRNASAPRLGRSYWRRRSFLGGRNLLNWWKKFSSSCHICTYYTRTECLFQLINIQTRLPQKSHSQQTTWMCNHRTNRQVNEVILQEFVSTKFQGNPKIHVIFQRNWTFKKFFKILSHHSFPFRWLNAKQKSSLTKWIDSSFPRTSDNPPFRDFGKKQIRALHFRFSFIEPRSTKSSKLNSYSEWKKLQTAVRSPKYNDLSAQIWSKRWMQTFSFEQISTKNDDKFVHFETLKSSFTPTHFRFLYSQPAQMRTTIMVATIGSTLYTGYFKKLFSSSFSTSNLGTRRRKWQRRKQSRYSSESTTSATAALLDSSRPSNERYTKKTNNCLPEPLIRFQIAEMRRVSFATRSKTFSCYREPRSLVFHLSTQNEKIVYGCLYYAGKRFTISTNSVIYSFLFGIPVYFERINWSILICTLKSSTPIHEEGSDLLNSCRTLLHATVIWHSTVRHYSTAIVYPNTNPLRSTRVRQYKALIKERKKRQQKQTKRYLR